MVALSLSSLYPNFWATKHGPILHFCSLALSFGFVRSTPYATGSSVCFPASFKSRRSPFPAEPQLSDADDEYEEEGLEEEEEDEEDFEAADEHDEVSLQASDDVEPSEDETEVPMDSGTRREDLKWQRVEKLCNLIRDLGQEMIDVDSLADIYDFRIDKFQRLAIEAFLRGSSVVVSAPTSSGKTLIAEAAAVATVAKGRRLLYTTPLKALSNQKFRQFRETFGDDNVGLLTGDSAVNKDAPVLVLTTEILRNMLYPSVGVASSRSGLFHVDVIVLDEVHYLSDISRGTVWEEIVIYCPKKVQLICLSATVANADELAGWINQINDKTELIKSSRRPVPLTWHFSTKSSLFPLLNEKGSHMNRKLSLNYLRVAALEDRTYNDDGFRKRKSRRRVSERDQDGTSNVTAPLSKNDKNMIRRSQVPQVEDTLWHLTTRDMLPAIWFIFNRRGCDAAVQYVEDNSLLNNLEMSEVDLALKKFRAQYPDAVRETAVKGLLRGVAAHHAGCLPLWKAFIEELFQRGLVKVVFATETLAAGINMPARTAVISSLSKRTSTGRIQLSPNDLLQMAGRAGRRGIDERGHVVLIQSPYEGAEECCKLLFSGIEPLVSQFTASYGMVLNLLAGTKITDRSSESDETRGVRARRTFEEARKLVEQSFGNYVGSNVMVAAKEELARIQKEIDELTYEISDEAIDRKSKMLLSHRAYKDIAALQEELRAEKNLRTQLRRKMEMQRLCALKPILEELEKGHLPFVCLQYTDSEGTDHSATAVYLGKVEAFNESKIKEVLLSSDAHAIDSSLHKSDDTVKVEGIQEAEPSYHVALGSDNSWYLFTEKWIRGVYRTGFPDVALSEEDELPREIMKKLLDKEEMQWEKLSESEFGGLWRMEGSLETWSWSLNVPVVSSLSENDEVLHTSEAYNESVEQYKEQRKRVARLRKTISRTEGFGEYKKIIQMARFNEEKIKRLKARAKHLTNRVEQIEPSGWKEFVLVSNVIHETRALDVNTNVLFPLGETAAAIRGENELWLAMVLRNKLLMDLKPAQLAAVCASVVSEGIKVRAWKNNNYIYEPSSTVTDTISLLDKRRNNLLQIQEKHGVEIPCCLDSQFAGMVEAWASGLSWRELMMDCAMDEGDLARLLRRTIDLLAQIPKLPDIDSVLRDNASKVADVMDRPPISELAG